AGPVLDVLAALGDLATRTPAPERPAVDPEPAPADAPTPEQQLELMPVDPALFDLPHPDSPADDAS
ncbi:hypothetical protein HF998_12395, partial [Cellulomonas hominis]|nr:hypothetical protein [Cellulomonas hominis]